MEVPSCVPHLPIQQIHMNCLCAENSVAKTEMVSALTKSHASAYCGLKRQ